VTRGKPADLTKAWTGPIDRRVGKGKALALNEGVASTLSVPLPRYQSPLNSSLLINRSRTWQSKRPSGVRAKKWICYGKRSGSALKPFPTLSLEKDPEKKKNEILDPFFARQAPEHHRTKSRASFSQVTPVQGFAQELAEPLGAISPENSEFLGMTKILYDQQNMIQCFKERNFYRLLFAFCYSMLTSFQRSDKGPTDLRSTSVRGNPFQAWLFQKKGAQEQRSMTPGGSGKRLMKEAGTKASLLSKLDVDRGSSDPSVSALRLSKAPTKSKLHGSWTNANGLAPPEQSGSNQIEGSTLSNAKRGPEASSNHSPYRTNPRVHFRKLILFGRSEVKRIIRKILFMNPESLVFAQVFLIPVVILFGVLYTFWTFSVSSTGTLKDFIPIAQLTKSKKIMTRPWHDRTSSSASRLSSFNFVGAGSFAPVGPTKSTDKVEALSVHQAQSAQPKILTRLSPIYKRLQTLSNATRSRDASSKQQVDLNLRPSSSWESFVSEPLIRERDMELKKELEELTFFTSYKVDWSPTRGISEFLRFTNSALKIFILWASLYVFRSIRPVKANRPEMRIQTRLLRPFQNRKRFSDLEGIEKFSEVLTTFKESIQGSFKDPLFYLVMAIPDFPFLYSFKKAIGKIRLFLFYGKYTAFLRKPFNDLIGILSEKEKKKQAQTYPKGYLFIGPPGTGKTLLAQAIAGESKVNLICLSASEIQKQIDIGTRIGALRLRNLFEEARTLTPCILFFDEIDTLGRAREDTIQQTKIGQRLRARPDFRSSPMSSQRDRSFSPSGSFGLQVPEKARSMDLKISGKQTPGSEIDLKLFTEFLVQMDSFSVKDGFLVIGTTNFLSSLDPAFVRSGRFDRILGLTYPPKKTRIAILKLHIHQKGNLFHPQIPWNIFGVKTKDFSPADLSKVVNESSLYLLNQMIDEPANLLTLSSPTVGPRSVDLQTVDSASPKATKFGWVFDFLQDLFLFQPGLIHTSRSLREGVLKILQSKKD